MVEGVEAADIEKAKTRYLLMGDIVLKELLFYMHRNSYKGNVFVGAQLCRSNSRQRFQRIEEQDKWII